MSSLLSQASLVMIPSGYKEDVVYSVIPTNGNGDLSFTRASNGTRVNSAGLVEVCPWNLVQQSETIGVSPWVNQNVTITNNATTAPNGTSTAEKITENTSNGYHQVYQEIFASGSVVGQDYTFSCYAKASERTKISLALQTPDISIATFDLINGTASITGGSGTAGVAIESVGNGWYRCSIYRLNTTTGYIYGNLQMNDGSSTSYTGDGTSGVFVYGAQLNIGSTAKTYFPTTDRLNVPRLTYQNGGGGCPSLLLEKQSTNLLLWSEQFDNADWSKIGATITANATISPDGTQNADKLIEDTSTGNHRIVNTAFAVNNGNAHSQSWYVKYFNNQWIQLNRGQEGSGYLNFDLINGVVGYTGGITDYQISNMANGWYRISINYVVTGTYATAGISILDTNVNARYESYVGDGTSGVYIWGCQYEQSSYPTSYIPTTSSSATRVADACFKTGISSLIGATEGVIFVDFNNVTNPEAGDYNMLATISDSANDYIYISKRNPTGIEIYGGAGASTYITSGVFVDGQRYKVAFAYKNNDFAVYINGSSIWTDTSGTINFTTPNKFSLGSYYSQILNLNSGINQAALFKTRLTNAELASLTTI